MLFEERDLVPFIRLLWKNDASSRTVICFDASLLLAAISPPNQTFPHRNHTHKMAKSFKNVSATVLQMFSSHGIYRSGPHQTGADRHRVLFDGGQGKVIEHQKNNNNNKKQ